MSEDLQKLADECNELLGLLEKEDPCWKDYEAIGMKTKDGKKVPNCVPKKEESEELEEARVRKKVIRGKKLKVKFKCTAPGTELVNGTCKRKSATRKITLKKAKKKEKRTKRQLGAGAKRRANIKRQKSLKKRVAFGLK